MSELEPLPKLGEPNGWQRFCTEELMSAVKLPEDQRARAWSETRKKLTKLARSRITNPRQQRIIIADALLRNLSLRNFDFSYCYIIRTEWGGANLRGARFNYAIIRDCIFKDANANGTNFSRADIEGTNFENLRYDSRTKLDFARFEPAGLLSPQFEDRINRDRLAISNRNAPVLNRFLNLLTDYGFGIGRVLLVCATIILLFAVAYRAVGAQGFAIGAGTLKPETLTFWNFLLLSTERFLNASPWIYGVSPLTHFFTTLETLAGLFGLGLLVAMLIRQVLRSS